MSGGRIGIFGAGAIGAYLGIRLSAAGVPVTLIGRPELVDAWPKLKALDLAGESYRPSKSLKISTDPADLADCEACLVTVKSGDTSTAADAIARHLKSNVPIISLQNGIRNVALIRSRFNQPVLPGMVMFNVRREDDATFRRTTSGPIVIGGGPSSLNPIIEQTQKAGEPFIIQPHIESVQTAKLLLNLNNGLCALTGLSIADSLRNRDLRRAFAACLSEGVQVMKHSHRPIGRIGPLSPGLVARVLPMPDWIFFRVAKSMMAIDPAARSSTLQDIDRGRKTEIDYLNGEIVRLASENGMPAPLNAFVTENVHRLEQASGRPPFMHPAEVWAQVQQLSRGRALARR